MRKQLTVGEMIASHHWRDALRRARAGDEVFWKSPIGRALDDFERKTARMAEVGAMDYPSDRQLEASDAAYRSARQVLLTLIRIEVGL